MGTLSSYGGKLSNFGNTGTAAATPPGIDDLILAMGGWKTNGASTITPSIVMSRSSNGVDTPAMWTAPCAVVFDAEGTTDTDTAYPFADCLFYWDFGDDTGEFWEYGARAGTQSKNNDFGPIAGHVYETPGTYTITLTVLNASGGINTATQSITVTDPDTVFSGLNTVCVSTDAGEDWAGAPAGCDTVISSNISGVFAKLGSGKRFLYKRGQVFSSATTSGLNIINYSNIHIADWGDAAAADPEFRVTATNAVGLYLWANNGVLDNISVYNINFTNPSQLSGTSLVKVILGTSTNSILDDRGHLTFCNNTFSNGALPALGGKGCAAVGNYADVFGGAGVVGAWGSNIHDSMWLGNYIDNHESAEHNARIQGGRKCVLAHNHYKDPAFSKHCLSIRGSNASTAGQTISVWAANTARSLGGYSTPTTPNGYIYRVSDVTGDSKTGASEPVTWPTTLGETVASGNVTFMCEYVDSTATTPTAIPCWYLSNFYNIRDNVFDVSGLANLTQAVNYTTTIQSSNELYYEVMQDILWEGNHYTHSSSPYSTSYTSLRIQSAQRVTVRNNIFNMTHPTYGDFIGVQTVGGTTAAPTGSGTPTCTDIRVHNNTFFSSTTQPTATDTFVGIHFSGTLSTGMEAKGNLFYFPNAHASGLTTIADSSVSTVISNNSDATQTKSSNPFSVASPSAIADFKLKSDSYARAAGVNIAGNYLDIYRTAINRQSVDMGAISKDS